VDSSLEKQKVAKRIRGVFERAVAERSGASLLLTAAEQALVSEADLELIKEETGYNGLFKPRVLQKAIEKETPP
jgi:hypothetical protein